VLLACPDRITPGVSGARREEGRGTNSSKRTPMGLCRAPLARCPVNRTHIGCSRELDHHQQRTVGQTDSSIRRPPHPWHALFGSMYLFEVSGSEGSGCRKNKWGKRMRGMV